MIVLSLIVIIDIILCFTLFKERKMKDDCLNKKIYYILIGIFLLLAAFLLFYKLGYIPHGLHVDEAGMAFDALTLSKHGVDRWLNKWPVYLINYGGGQSALYVYLAAIFIKIFGISNLTVRLPAAILSFLSIWIFKKLMDTNNNKLFSLISLIFMIICPFTIMKSRWGLDCYLLFPMLVFSLYFFYKAITTNKKIYYFIAGLLFGLTLYTYVIGYVIIAAFLFIIIIYLLIIKKIKFSDVVVFGIPLGILAFPLIIMVFNNAGIISLDIDFKIFTIPKLWFHRSGEMALAHVNDNFNIFYLLFANDTLYYNLFPKFGSIYYISIPFLTLGLIITVKRAIATLKKKDIDLDLIMVVLFAVTLGTLFLVYYPNVNKANALFIPIIYMVSVGIYYCVSKNKISAIIISLCYLICFISFANYYFIDYPKEVQNKYQFVDNYDLYEALDIAHKHAKDDKIIYVNDGSSRQNYIYTLLYEKVNPYEFNESVNIVKNDVKGYANYIYEFSEVDNDGVYVLFKDDSMVKTLVESGFKTEKTKNFIVLYNDVKIKKKK